MVTFTHENVSVSDISVESHPSDKPGKKPVVSSVNIGSDRFRPSDRFWISMSARFGISPSIYKYFGYDEVFNRISRVAANDRVRVAIERRDGISEDDDRRDMVLAATNPKRVLIGHSMLMDVLEEAGNEGHKYLEGVVTSTHDLRNNDGFEILGDSFKSRFTMETPIDGYGKPNIYLTLLRMVCLNGMIGYAKAFRTQLEAGKGGDDVRFSLTRNIGSFDNEEGFSAMRQRFESAGQSWASLYEALLLSDTLYKARIKGALGTREQGAEIMTRFHEVTGDMVQHYGLVSLESLSKKRMQSLPARTTVYDLINFATEVATHHCNHPLWEKKIQSYVGNMISQEYDLEGTKEQYSEFADFFVNQRPNLN